MNFPFICSYIPAAPTYRVYISQLIWYSRACGSYQDFLDRGLLLTRKLLNQRFLLVKLKSSLRKFYDRHHDLVDRYGISVSQMTTDMFQLSLSGVHFTRSLVLCVCFVDRCLSFCTFRLVIALSVLLRFTDSGYLYVIFKLFLQNLLHLNYLKHNWLVIIFKTQLIGYYI